MADLILLKDFDEIYIELWLPVQGRLGYEVSTKGRVRSFWHSRRALLTTRAHYLKPFFDQRGYPLVSMQCDGKKVTRRIHRLVAETFLPNLDCKPQVNHRNGIKTDNRLANLEWATVAENITHATQSGLHVYGEISGRCKWSDALAERAREMFNSGYSYGVMAKTLHVPRSSLCFLIHRRKTRSRVESEEGRRAT